MKNVILDIVGEIDELRNKTLNLKGQFGDFISDAEIPLAERWNTWLLAPVELKETSGWISSGRLASLPEDFVSYDGPYYSERYQTVELTHVAEHFEEWLEDEELSEEEAINDLKEEILSKNLHSYEYDW